MSKVIKECSGCSSAEMRHDRPVGTNGQHTYDDCTEIDPTNAAAKQEADDLLEKLRAANKQIVLQWQRIEELEAYLHCIVSLSAKVRELELDASL
jgi:hypothetical protein